MEQNLFVTRDCNLACSYCYLPDKRKEKMSREVGERAIDFYFDRAYSGAKLNLNFHGGEPLLEFELIRHLTNYMKEKNVNNFPLNFTFTTNGTLVCQEMVDFIVKNNFGINISLDGTEQVHDLHRRTVDQKPTFNKVLKALEMLRDAGSNCTVRLTVTPETITQLVENVNWLVKKGFYHLSIGIDIFSDWTNNLSKLENAYRELKNIYLTSSQRLNIDLFDGKLSLFLLTGKPLYCNAGFGQFTIDPIGDIYPCVYVTDNPDFKFGTLDSLIPVEEREEIVRAHSINHQMCEGCEIGYFCLGRKCWYLNYLSTGYLTLPDQILCKHEKLLYELVGEIVEGLYHKKDPELFRMLEIIRQNPHLEVNEEVKKYL